jgi:hypothetical protein
MTISPSMLIQFSMIKVSRGATNNELMDFGEILDKDEILRCLNCLQPIIKSINKGV